MVRGRLGAVLANPISPRCTAGFGLKARLRLLCNLAPLGDCRDIWQQDQKLCPLLSNQRPPTQPSPD